MATWIPEDVNLEVECVSAPLTEPSLKKLLYYGPAKYPDSWESHRDLPAATLGQMSVHSAVTVGGDFWCWFTRRGASTHQKNSRSMSWFRTRGVYSKLPENISPIGIHHRSEMHMVGNVVYLSCEEAQAIHRAPVVPVSNFHTIDEFLPTETIEYRPLRGVVGHTTVASRGQTPQDSLYEVDSLIAKMPKRAAEDDLTEADIAASISSVKPKGLPRLFEGVRYVSTTPTIQPEQSEDPL